MIRFSIISSVVFSGIILALLVSGCSDSPDARTLATPLECNPLGGTGCITPWPSSIYAVDDPDTATGRRLDIPTGALPRNQNGLTIAPDRFNQRDGFSPAAPMIAAFPGGVDPGNLVSHTDYAASLTDASPTVLLDMSTGQRVAHFAEIDLAAADTPDQQALYIRPAARLNGSTRYAVAIRRALKAPGGGDLPIPEGFAAILDDQATTHPLLERTRARYDDIFAALAQAGVPQNDLVVAWDFTTASDHSLRRDVVAARDAALDMMCETGPCFDVLEDRAHDDPNITRYIHGTFQAPLFLTQGGAYAPDTVLARDAAGLPAYQGLYPAPFWAIVPECAYDAAAPVPVMIYGHGLLGTGEQATGGTLRDTAAALCMILIGTDMRGMSTPDLANVAFTLNDLNKAPWVFEALIQGIINHIALQYMVRGPMAAELFVDETGTSLADPTRVVYYGLSQGHIFGSTFMAFDPFISRGVVGVGAANYSMMLERSADFTNYRIILENSYTNPLDLPICLNLMQMDWDVTDPSGTANDVLTGAIAGTPPKQMLLHMSVADEEVPNLATEWQARTMGVPLLGPAPFDVYGLATEQGPVQNALVIWDGGFDPPPVGNVPPVDTDSHYVTRRQPAALRQMATFYATGEIHHECGETACYCAQGACE
jgi:hypothetical protein